MTTDTGAAPSSFTGTGSVARAAQSVRRVAVALLSVRPDLPELGDIAATIHGLADDLGTRACPVDERVHGMSTTERIVPYSPVVGTANAVAPPLLLRPAAATGDGPDLEGTVTFSPAYQAMPGTVHDGAAAMVLDVALADANVRAGVPGMTVELVLRFHRPLPVDRELTVRAWHDSVDGRKARSHGEIRWGPHLCVSARGLFVVARGAAAP